ncbi:MAG: hypothetical protein ACP5GX_12525 [Anaerolineae bacterium]
MQLSLFSSREQPEFAIGLLSLFLSAFFLALGHFIGYSNFHSGAFDGVLPLLPILFGVAALGLGTPFVARWKQRRRLCWLLIPVVVLLMDALLFRFYRADMWVHWRTRWPLVPIGLGLSLYAVYFLGRRWRYLLLASTVITSSGMLMLAFFSAFLEEMIYAQPYIPAVLYLCGITLVVFNLLKARAY